MITQVAAFAYVSCGYVRHVCVTVRKHRPSSAPVSIFPVEGGGLLFAIREDNEG